jgi:hypothetical protein
MGPDASAAGAGRTPAVGSYSLDGALTDVPVMLHPTASLRPQSVLALKLRQLHHKVCSGAGEGWVEKKAKLRVLAACRAREDCWFVR